MQRQIAAAIILAGDAQGWRTFIRLTRTVNEHPAPGRMDSC